MYQRGFAGIIVLLISLAIISLLFFYAFPAQKVGEKSHISQELELLNEVKDLKDSIEEKSAHAMDEL